MLSWIRRIVAPVAAIVVLCVLPAATRADTVTYYTKVYFTAAGSGTHLGGSAVTTALGTGFDTLISNSNPSNNAVAVSLNSSTVEVYPGIALPATFGSFDINESSVQVLIGSSIRIDVFQQSTNPAPAGDPTGAGAFVGSADATFFGSSLSHIDLKFLTGPTVSFELPGNSDGWPPNVRYTLQDQVVYDSDSPPQFRLNSTIAGTATAVPLPATAMAGMSLLGGFGGLSGLTGLVRYRRALAA